VVGGIAVSFRSVERTTKDLDLAVAVDGDDGAEKLVSALARAGYRIETVLEHDVANRLSTVRLISIGEVEMFVDLLFASSGIEPEIVAKADDVEIFPGIVVPVASTPALIAMKVLSADPVTRLQDIIDLRNLITDASDAEIDETLDLLSLITQRGFNRGKDLHREMARYLNEHRLSTS
jgi:hypothetical protein